MNVSAPGRRHLSTAFLLYLAFVVYGSLIPFDYRAHSFQEALQAFAAIRFLDLGVVSRADWVANILLYMPLAFLGCAGLLGGRPTGVFRLALVLATCVTVAFAIEFTQIFFAPRTVSINDLIAEGIGSVLGTGAWLASRSRLAGLASALVRPGPAALSAGLALYALAYLGLALFPYDFVVSLSELQWKLLRGNYGWGGGCGSLMRCASQWLAQVAVALPLGLLLARWSQRRPFGRLGAVLIAVVIGMSIEAAQFLLASGVSTLSAALATAAGIGFGLWLRDPPSPRLAQRHARRLRPALLLALPFYLGLVALLNDWGGVAWGDGEILRANLASQRYLPFYYHYFTTETEAVASLLAQAALYLPLGIGFWLWHASGQAPLARPLRLGLSLATAALAFVIETGKLYSPHSHPDPTNLLIAVGAAWLGQRLCQWLAECVRATPSRAAETQAVPLPRKALVGTALVVFVLGAIGLVLIRQTADSEAVEMARIRHEIPAAESLPPAVLPHFRQQHPRLPSPTEHDRLRLRQENPDFLAVRRKEANGGKGKLDAAILMAYVEPGSQDLEAILAQLMALKFSWRGHEQVKSIALAYDWLHPQWTEAQRLRLRDKLAQGCNHLIEVIRSGRFSPYNATLYGGPAQALMACGITLYGDDPRGEALMVFTVELWKNRILPVWRQVMGEHGGWHEGADSIAAGIGQAVYQLPAMWRGATGEDLFRSEPGIRGFLDFLVYRTRPDGSQMRLGDSAVFDRDAPDRRALALEYRHAAAYSLAPPPKAPVPSSWPWGPLADHGLYDADALSRLPLTRHFDGIGLVVMRSGWGPDASYITFKAGDNYSSLTHLDQGSFTIYKGGALAIDSGLYYKYGSAHHLNYAYQTIAHNVATVTDPDEAHAIDPGGLGRASPGLANDGGQRRVGGNIEIYPHPLDVDEWQAKRELYHTGEIMRLSEQNDIVTISADITAAYTNKYSEEGTRSSRTLRVRRYLRTLIYDRINDLVLVYDHIDKHEPEFVSRWLIHFQDEPRLLEANRFLAEVAAMTKPARRGGALEGQVVLPERPRIERIGGAGREFWVDGRNYDDGGDIHKAQARGKGRQAESGAWRLEIAPEAASQTEVFLVALSLKASRSEPGPFVQCTRGDGVIDCAVQGRRGRQLRIAEDGSVVIQ